MKLLILASVLLLFSLPNKVSSCCSECHCWEKCFSQVPSDLTQSYLSIRQVVDTIRNLRTSFNVHGTAYLMDSTESDGNVWNYQKNLAALVALTQSVGKECNPFVLSKYYKYYALRSSRWHCLESCPAAKLLLGLTHSAQDSSNWLEGGCINARGAFQSCANNKRPKMAISFMNNNVQMKYFSANYCGFYKVRAGISIRSGVNPFNGYYEPLPQAKIVSAPYTDANAKALDTILNCVQKSCCFNAVQEAERADNIIYYNEKGSTETKTFRGTEEDFIKMEAPMKKQVPCRNRLGVCTG